LRELLEDIIPHHTTVEEFEVERDFPDDRTPHDAAECPKVFL